MADMADTPTPFGIGITLEKRIKFKVQDIESFKKVKFAADAILSNKKLRLQ